MYINYTNKVKCTFAWYVQATQQPFFLINTPPTESPLTSDINKDTKCHAQRDHPQGAQTPAQSIIYRQTGRNPAILSNMALFKYIFCPWTPFGQDSCNLAIFSSHAALAPLGELAMHKIWSNHRIQHLSIRFLPIRYRLDSKHITFLCIKVIIHLKSIITTQNLTQTPQETKCM